MRTVYGIKAIEPTGNVVYCPTAFETIEEAENFVDNRTKVFGQERNIRYEVCPYTIYNTFEECNSDIWGK